MSDTYEFKGKKGKLETYEWDRVWWEQTSVEDKTRVFYIGDSISCATRECATKASNNTILFDGFGTSKSLDNPYFTKSLTLCMEQQGERKAILLNNGLHGWHLKDDTEYKEEYEKMINFLLKIDKSAQLILVLTTHVASEEEDERVQARNAVVIELAKKYCLPIIDLYSVSKAHEDLICEDGVHMLPEGYQLLAQELVKGVCENIK